MGGVALARYGEGHATPTGEGGGRLRARKNRAFERDMNKRLIISRYANTTTVLGGDWRPAQLSVECDSEPCVDGSEGGLCLYCVRIQYRSIM